MDSIAPPVGTTTDRTTAPAAPRSSILGLPVDAVDMDGAVERIHGWVVDARRLVSGDGAGTSAPGTLGAPRARHVITLNPEMVMMARRDATFRAIVTGADLVVADGVGILWAARWCGQRLPGRVTGVDLLVALAARAARDGARLFLLGAAPGVAEVAAAHVCRRFPGLIFAGVHAGIPDTEGDAEALERIRAAQADILFVAYGAPAQERWIARHRDRLDAVVAIGVGGAFDFLAERVPRAPRWMRRLGLEWLFRLACQPWRWRRMLALPRFVGAVLAGGRGGQRG